jgi:hypothetical protein
MVREGETMYANATCVGYSYDVKFKAVFGAYSDKETLDDAEDDVMEMHDKAMMANDFDDLGETKVDKQTKLEHGWKMKVYSSFSVNVNAPDYEEALDVAVGVIDEMELPGNLHLETYCFDTYEMVSPEPEYVFHEEWG